MFSLSLSRYLPSVARNVPAQAHGASRIISDRLLRFGILGLLVGVAFAAPASAQQVRIPYRSECTHNAEQVRIASDILQVDVCKHIEAGLLAPGEVYDMDQPVNNFSKQLFKWVDMLNKEDSSGSLDYKEVIQFNKVEDAFKRLQRWEKQRRQARPNENE